MVIRKHNYDNLSINANNIRAIINSSHFKDFYDDAVRHYVSNNKTSNAFCLNLQVLITKIGLCINEAAKTNFNCSTYRESIKYLCIIWLNDRTLYYSLKKLNFDANISKHRLNAINSNKTYYVYLYNELIDCLSRKLHLKYLSILKIAPISYSVDDEYLSLVVEVKKGKGEYTKFFNKKYNFMVNLKINKKKNCKIKRIEIKTKFKQKANTIFYLENQDEIDNKQYRRDIGVDVNLPNEDIDKLSNSIIIGVRIKYKIGILSSKTIYANIMLPNYKALK